jgi:hypothetical protein
MPLMPGAASSAPALAVSRLAFATMRSFAWRCHPDGLARWTRDGLPSELTHTGSGQ